MLSKRGLLISKNFCHDFKTIKLKHQWIPPEGYDTGIKVYSRITKKNVPLIFPRKNFVKWYICGPTVYDVSHIGHASCYIRFDILNRILKNFFDIHPVVALGITDIDDKIIKQSYKLNVDYKTLAKKHELEFFEELKALNILPPSFVLRVTEHIPDIVDYIYKIVEKKEAYVVKDGSVYFNTELYKDKWKFITPPKKGANILKEGQRSFVDFALWKTAKEGEPFWDSPWGKGRPGWHIECSAMVSKLFGSNVDLHGGGIDLVFPHHENEEFQSCSYHGCDQWVNYWLHTGHLEVHGEKMSKSLKNYISVAEFLEKYTADNLRMFCFVSHYRRELNFSKEAMELPVTSCNMISRFLADANSYIKGSWTRGNISETVLLQKLDETKKLIKEQIMNDFSTHHCYKTLMELIQNTVTMLNENPDLSASRSPAAVAAVSQYVNEIFQSFGFHFDSVSLSQDKDFQKFEFLLDKAVNFRSQVREEALSCTEKQVKHKLLKACDVLRDDYATVGITIKDLNKSSSSWSMEQKKRDSSKPKAESVV